MITIIRSQSTASDSRVNKYTKYLTDKNIPYRLIGWNRTGEDVSGIPNATFYIRKAGYNVGGFKAAWNRVKWFSFCFSTLRKNRCRNIHACDLDTAFPAVLYKLTRRRKTYVIFDIFDWFSSTLYNQNFIIRACFKVLERISVKNSDEIILCEKERIAQIPYKLKEEPLILPNIPYFKDESFLAEDPGMKFGNGGFTVSYVGGLYGERFLDELLDLAQEGGFNLSIAGYGDKGLEERCVKLSELDNVRYYGKVPYEKGLNIMYNSDVIYAMYCKTNPNHIYAAPNKYYETMLLSKPIISTEGIIIAEKIEKDGIGYVIPEDKQCLRSLILSLNTKDIEEKGLRARRLWEREYKNYTHEFMENIYSKLARRDT